MNLVLYFQLLIDPDRHYPEVPDFNNREQFTEFQLRAPQTRISNLMDFNRHYPEVLYFNNREQYTKLQI